MPDYCRGKLYRLVTDLSGDIYVGSTTLPLRTRMTLHRWAARSGGTSKVWAYMREHGIGNFRIELIEDYPCENADQLDEREDHWRERLGATLNMKRAVSPRREQQRRWYQKNLDKRRAQLREYARKRRAYLKNK